MTRRMNSGRVVLVLTLGGLFMLPAGAAAQGKGKGKDRAGDRREIKEHNRELRDDRLDLTRLKTIRADFVRARKSKSRAKLRKIDSRLRELLGEEAKEGRKEVGDSRRDLRTDRRQHGVVADPKERRQHGVVADPVERRQHGVVADPVERRQHGVVAKPGQGATRDAKRDLRQESLAQLRLQQIRGEMGKLYGKYDRRSLNRRAVLMDELIEMAKLEKRRDRRELKQDRRERRDDRRRGRRQ